MAIHPDNEAIDALGGTVATAKLLKVNSSVVSNWRQRGVPGRHHLAFARHCAAVGHAWPNLTERLVTGSIFHA